MNGHGLCCLSLVLSLLVGACHEDGGAAARDGGQHPLNALCGPSGECDPGLVCDPAHPGCPTGIDADGGCKGPYDDVFASTCQFYRDPFWTCDDGGCRCTIRCGR